VTDAKDAGLEAAWAEHERAVFRYVMRAGTEDQETRDRAIDAARLAVQRLITDPYRVAIREYLEAEQAFADDGTPPFAFRYRAARAALLALLGGPVAAPDYEKALARMEAADAACNEEPGA